MRLALTVREAQALNSARFRSLIDNAWDLIVVAEADLGSPTSPRPPSVCSAMPPSELQGKPFTDLVHPDDVHGRRRAPAGLRATTTTETAVAFEIRMRHAQRRVADDRLDRHRTSSTTLSVNGYVLNGGDVTEARQAAEDLAAARDGALWRRRPSRSSCRR